MITVAERSPSTQSSRHVDLIRVRALEGYETFLRRLPLDDSLLVKPDGSPTQLAQGWATYLRVSEPHTPEECPYA